MLQRKEAIAILESGDPFDIRFVKCSESKKTGGQWVDGKGCQCTGNVNKKVGTVNILFPDQQYRKAHISLMTRINGELIV